MDVKISCRTRNALKCCAALHWTSDFEIGAREALRHGILFNGPSSDPICQTLRIVNGHFRARSMALATNWSLKYTYSAKKAWGARIIEIQ
jgi:hypothetical protein